jgi:chaperonin GroEL
VAIDRILDDRMPEILDDGGTIARRITQLSDPNEDVGAMIVRDFLLRLQDQVGDGTATGAILFQSVYNQSVRYLISGGNVIRMRYYLEKGMRGILNHLSAMTVPLVGEEKITQLAETLCHDSDMAGMMGEISNIIGEYGRLEIRPGCKLSLEREYVEGMYWEKGVVSRKMITDHKRFRTEMENAFILISDLKIENPNQLQPVIALAYKAGIRSLLIVAGKFSESAIALMLLNSNPEKLQIIAVNTPGWDDVEQAWALEDLAVLTGGHPFLSVTGDTLDKIKLEDLGRARKVWADRLNFGIVGGKGNPRSLRKHIANLRVSFEKTAEPVFREKLRSRIGKLMGGTAVLWVGGSTELEIANRQELAKRTAAVIREALMSGVLPGGGVSLLSCQSLLKNMLNDGTDPDERAAYNILINAVEEPIRTIISNAGYEAGEIMAKIKMSGPGYGFDVNSGSIVNMMEKGIWDAAAVVQFAVYGAISTAALSLTIDVMVHRKQQNEPVTIRPPSLKKRLTPR